MIKKIYTLIFISLLISPFTMVMAGDDDFINEGNESYGDLVGDDFLKSKKSSSPSKSSNDPLQKVQNTTKNLNKSFEVILELIQDCKGKNTAEKIAACIKNIAAIDTLINEKLKNMRIQMQDLSKTAQTKLNNEAAEQKKRQDELNKQLATFSKNAKPQ